jgi:hypothetical protein
LRFRGDIEEATSGAKVVVQRLQALSEYLLQQAAALALEQDEARLQIEAEQRLAAVHARSWP